jgi:hypothetical protein
VDRWYDVVDADEEQDYVFRYDAFTANSPIYVTAETYGYNIIPN